MNTEDHTPIVLLRAFFQRAVEGLTDGRPLPRPRAVRELWRRKWARPAFPDPVSREELDTCTRTNKAFLMDAFRVVSDVLAETCIPAAEAEKMRQQIAAQRTSIPPDMACATLALDAALACVVLRAKPRRGKLGLCYSAFGDVARVAATYAVELNELLGGVFDQLHIFGCVGMNTTLPSSLATQPVHVHLRSITVPELVAWPGIKASGLYGACADAVRSDMDLVWTIDGDARLPLWETLPAIVALLECDGIDAVLGSRRVAGALVAKPGFRHLTSMANAVYVETVLGPVIGRGVHDPQALFKVMYGHRVRQALQRLGCRDRGLALSNLQDGSLAGELLLLAHLRDDGEPPQLVEVPAVETMAYTSNPRRMMILSSSNIRGMVAAANRVRRNVRGQTLVGEGTETVLLPEQDDGVVKMWRMTERPARQELLPSSRVTDNRLLDALLSMPRPVRTLVYGMGARRHPDRGIGPRPVVWDLVHDKRPGVRACLPADMRLEYRNHTIRLPLFAAVALSAWWVTDRIVMRSGSILERVGMMPMVLIRGLGAGLRLGRMLGTAVRFIMRPMGRVLSQVVGRCLRWWDRFRHAVGEILCLLMIRLENAGVLRVLAGIDRLDQRSPFFHRIVAGACRVVVELRWLLESPTVSIHPRQPVPCLVQPRPIRPLWQVLDSLPMTMTREAEALLDMACDMYRRLGDEGWVDGELSLDNLGIELDGQQARVVLTDYGAMVRADDMPAPVLVDWLRMIRTHYADSYQVYKLRAHFAGSKEGTAAAERHVGKVDALLMEWLVHAGGRS